MILRPTLRAGDVVRLSKKGKEASYPWPNDITLVVTKVEGDGVERRSVIHCRAIINDIAYEFKAYRHHLWKTGTNVFEKTSRVINSSDF